MIDIVHASISENGTAHNAMPGDQTHKEVCVRKWYNKPWDMILRHPDTTVTERAANIGVLLANSNLVGYDQDNRNTLYEELKKNSFSVSSYINSNVLTETDCSAFVTACFVCAGEDDLRYTGNAPTTRTMEKVFQMAGFNVLKEKKYLTTDEHLRKGDVLLKVGSHTVIACSSGSKAYSGSNIDYYPQYKGVSSSIIDALNSLGIDSSMSNRKRIAAVNGIADYTGTAVQNTKILLLLKQGYLIIPG